MQLTLAAVVHGTDHQRLRVPNLRFARLIDAVKRVGHPDIAGKTSSTVPSQYTLPLLDRMVCVCVCVCGCVWVGGCVRARAP
jgi:hypothetical protein